MDFDSKIFDNSNAGFKSDLPLSSSTLNSFFVGTGDMVTNNNNTITKNNNNTITLNNNNNSSMSEISSNHHADFSKSMDTNPFVPQVNTTEMYTCAFDTSVQTTLHSSNANNDTLQLAVT